MDLKGKLRELEKESLKNILISGKSEGKLDKMINFSESERNKLEN